LDEVIAGDNVEAEYDLDVMKRNGHPLRKKLSQGEFKLINPLDVTVEIFRAFWQIAQFL